MPDPNVSLVDIGANLGHDSFRHDLDEVLDQARQAGLQAILVTGTSVDSSVRALALARHYPGFLFSTAGVHPHDADSFDRESPARLVELAAQPEVRALGEMGLDFNRDFSPRKCQEEVFEEQLSLACELQMPVFLHERDAHGNFCAILKKYRDRLLRAVVHCFSGTREELYHYLDLDMYIGITGWICDERRGGHLHALLKDIPADRLMLETDAPYLLPRSILPKPAGRRNEPRYLVHVLDTVAQCLELSPPEIAARTSTTARFFFDI
ncbi:MAG: TatD family hydrolase [Pseudomonadales bacterium]|nr:TatD family hydrolase [Pseudomonadales bacterium]